MEITAQDWEAMQSVAGRIGFPGEHISSLQRRLEDPPARPGTPYMLLAGRPEAGLHLLLSRWLGADAELLREIGERPVVFGREPQSVAPKLGAWGARKSRLPADHLIALEAQGKPLAITLAQLASLGSLDLAIIVTRLSQPLSQKERETAQALAGLAATVRVLVVALPGEETSVAEAAEVASYAQSQMRQAGFGGGRCLGAALWYTDGKARQGAITDPAQLLAADPAEVQRGKSGMREQALAGLLAELRAQAEKAKTAPAPAIPRDDQERLAGELGDYLSDLGKELERQRKAGRIRDTEGLHGYVRDALRGWGAYIGVEGTWLKYVERLRPGLQDAFFTEAEDALPLLALDPGSTPVASAPGERGKASASGLVRMAKRACVGFAFSLAAWLAVSSLLGGGNSGTSPAAVTLLSNAALLVGAFLGYGLAGFVFRTPRPARPADTEPARPAAIHGWPQLERRLGAWFGEQIRARPSSPQEDLAALSERLHLEESIHE